MSNSPASRAIRAAAHKARPTSVACALGVPFAVQFLGKPFAEPTLIKLASAFEAATSNRKMPVTTPVLASEKFSYSP